ncbi:DotU family type IV/VI secretion system protein [Escherichia coli]|nr:DotU family type IV/VI secretion system protein [Escherichia coli]
MRQDIDIDQLMMETWLTVAMLKNGAVTPDGTALYNKCVKQVESVREALERAGYDDASVEHITYAQCALLDETVMSRKPEKNGESGRRTLMKARWPGVKCRFRPAFLAHFGLVRHCGIALQRFCVSLHRTRPF